MPPIQTDDAGFLDRLLALNPAFRSLVEERRAERRDGRVSSLESVRQRLLPLGISTDLKLTRSGVPTPWSPRDDASPTTVRRMLSTIRPIISVLPGFAILLRLHLILLAVAGSVAADDDGLLFTPPGFARPGQPRTASGSDAATLRITVVDRATGKPTACRLNVVGPDGDFYQPRAEPPHPVQPDRPVAQDRQGEPRREGAVPLLRAVLLHHGAGRGEGPAGRGAGRGCKGFEYRPAVGSRRGRRRNDPSRCELELDRAVDMKTARPSFGRPPPPLRPSRRRRRPRDPRPDGGRGHPLRLDPRLQRAGRAVHRRHGDDGLRPSSAAWGKPRSRGGATT